MEAAKSETHAEVRGSAGGRSKREHREEVQARVYSRWINFHLSKTRYAKEIRNLRTDLRDGRAILALIEALNGTRLSVTKGGLDFHHLDNLDRAIKFLRGDRVLLVNLTSKDIHAGNLKMIFVFLEALILRYHVREAGKNQHQVRELVFHWAKETCSKFPSVKSLHNFAQSFSDGLALNALIHNQSPSLFDFDNVTKMKPEERATHAINLAEKEWKVPRLIDPTDIACGDPDDKVVFLYVASLYNVFPHDVILPSLIPRLPAVSKPTYQRSPSPGNASTTGFKMKKSQSDHGISSISKTSHVTVRVGSSASGRADEGEGNEKKSTSLKIQLGSSKRDVIASPSAAASPTSAFKPPKIQATSAKTIKIQTLRAEVQSLNTFLTQVEQGFETPSPHQGTNAAKARTFYTEHQDRLKHLHERSQEVTSLIDRSNTVIKSQPSSEDIRGLHRDVGELGKRWNRVTSSSREKGRKISKVVVSTQEAQLGTLENWLERVDKHLESWDGEAEGWQEEHLKLHQASLDKFRDIVTDSYLLIDMSANTQRQFKQRLEKDKRHWEKVQRLLDMKKMRLERKEDLYGVYAKRYETFVKIIEREGAVIKSGSARGKKKTELERFQRRRKGFQEELDLLVSDGEAFMKTHPEREEAGLVRTQLDSVAKEWATLTQNMEQELVAVSFGFDRVMELKGRLVEISGWVRKTAKEKLNEKVSLEDLRDIERELDEAKKVQGELASRYSAFQTLSLAAKHLSSLAKGKQKKTKSERDAEVLMKNVNDFQKTWDEFRETVEERNWKLEKAQINLQRFTGKMEELFVWLDDAETIVIDPPEPVASTFKALAEGQKELQNAFDMACSLGNEIIHDDPSAETVKKELDSVKQRWADVDVVLRQRLNLDEEKEKGEGNGNEIGVAVREIESWLSETEAGVIDVNVEACEQKDGSFVDVSGRVSKLEDWLSESSARKERLESLSLCPVRDSAHLEPLRAVRERLVDVTSVLNAKRTSLETARQEINDFDQNLDDLVAWIESSRKVLRVQLKADEESKGRLRVIEIDLENRKAQVKKLSVSSNSVAAQSLPKQAASLERKMETALRDFNQLSLSLASKWKEVEADGIGLEETVKEVEGLVSWLADLKQRVEAASQIQGIEEQFQQCQAFRDELLSHQADLTDVTRHVAALQSSRDLVSKHETLRNDYDALNGKLSLEKDQLQATLAFARSLMDAQDWLTQAEEQLDAIAESPLGYGISAQTALKTCREFRAGVATQRRAVDEANATSRADMSDSDREFVEACRERLVELNGRFSVLLDNGSLLEKRLMEVEVFERHSDAFFEWLARMEAIASAGIESEKRDGLITEAEDRAAEFEDVLRFFRDIEGNIEEDSARTYRKRVAELQNRYHDVRALVSGADEERRMVTFDIINVEVHPSAAEDTMLMDNEGVAGAVAEMSDDQISLLRKFDQSCSEIATELEVAESDYRDISATSSSVDDMLDKCERLQMRLERQRVHVDRLEFLASTLLAFCDERNHPDAAEVFNVKLNEQLSHYKALKADTDKEHETLSQAANFAQQILEVVEWIVDADQLAADLTKEQIGAQKSVEIVLKESKSLESDLSSYEDSIREVTEEGVSIIPHLDPEVADVFNKKLEEMNEQYARLSTQSKQFSEMLEKVQRFDSTLSSLSQWCQEVKEQLETTQIAGKELDVVLATRSPDMERLPSQLVDSCKDLPPSSLAYFTERVQAVQKDYRALASQPDEPVIIEIVQREQAPLDETTPPEELDGGEFREAVRTLRLWASAKMECLSETELPSAEMKVLKQQIESHMDFQDDNEARLQEFEKVCRDLSDRGLSNDAVELEKVEHELMEASSKREKALESAMEASRKFHAHLGNVLSWIDDMEEKAEEKNPEVFKVFVSDFERGVTDVELLGTLGAKLSALCGSPSQIATEIDSIRARYDAIKHKIDDRSRQSEYSALNKDQLMQEVSKLKCWLQTVEKWLLMQQSVRQERLAAGDQQAASEELEKCGTRLDELKMRRFSIESVLKTAHALADSCLGDVDDDVVVLVQEADYLSEFCDDVQKRCEEHQSVLHAAVTQQSGQEKGVVAVGFVLENPSDVLSAIADLRDWLATVHQWLSTQIPSQAIGEGSSAISLMLEDLNKCFGDLKLKQVYLDSISSAAHKLSDSTEGHITEMVMSSASVSQTFHTVYREVEIKRRTLGKAAGVAEKLQAKIEDFVAWLDDMDLILEDQEKPAADLEALADQLEKHQKLHADVLLHRDSLQSILQLARPLLKATGIYRRRRGDGDSSDDDDDDNSSDSGDDDDDSGGEGGSDLQETLHEIKARYREAGERVSAHQKALELAMQQLRDLCTQMQDMQFWILKVDQALMEKVEESDVARLKSQIEAHSVIAEEMEMKRAEYKALHESCDDFLGRSAESVSLARDVATLKRHWESGESKVRMKESQLQMTLMKLTSSAAASSSQNAFAHACLVVFSWLGPQEEQLRKPVDINADVDVLHEQCEKWNAIQKGVASRHPDMDHLNDLGEQAIKELSGSGGENLAAIERDVEQINDRWEAACGLASKRVKESSDALERVRDFYVQVEDLTDFLSATEKKLDKMKLGREFQTELDACCREFEDQNCVHDQVNRLADELIETSGNTPSSASLRVKMLRLNNSWSAVEEKVRELENKMTEKSEFLTALAGFSAWQREAQSRLDDNDPPMDDRVLVEETLTVLRAMQDDLAIHDEELRNLNDTSTFLSAEWPDFRRSSAHSTLESLNESYNALKEEVEGKQRRLKGHQERGQAWRARMSGVLVLLANAEKLDEASVHEGCEMAALQIQMANLMNLQRQVSAREGDLAEVNRTANEYQRPQLEGVNNRWESMKRVMGTREENVQKAIADLEDFHTELKSLQKSMMSLEQDIRSFDDSSDWNALLDRSSTCEATVTKIVAKGKEYVENSPTGSPAATALLKGLELFSTCWNDLKDLLERLEKNPTDVFVVSESMMISSPLTSVLMVTEQGFRSPSPLHAKPFPPDYFDGSPTKTGGVEDIEAVLAVVEKELASPQPCSSDLEAVSQQLERFESHSLKLRNCRPTLDELVSVSGSGDLSGSPEFTHPDGSVSQLRRRFETVLRNVEDRQRELASMHQAVVTVHSHLKTVESWISDAMGTLERSEHNDEVIEELRTNLKQRQGNFEAARIGANRICARGGGKERTTDRKLKQRVLSVSSRIDHLSRALTSRPGSGISPAAVSAFQESAASLTAWLDMLEVKASTATKDIASAEATEKLRELQELKVLFDGKKADLYAAKETSNRLLLKGHEGSTQVVSVKQTWLSLENRWYQLELILLRKLAYFDVIINRPKSDVLKAKFDRIHTNLTSRLAEIETAAQGQISPNTLKDLELQFDVERSHKHELLALAEQLKGCGGELAEIETTWKRVKRALDTASLSDSSSKKPVFPVAALDVATVFGSVFDDPRSLPAVETPVHYCLAVDDFLEWAGKVRSSLSRSLIVGEVAEVDRKLEETQKIERELQGKVKVYEHLANSGAKLLDVFGETSDEASSMRSKLDQLKTSWESFPSLLSDRRSSLRSLRPTWENFAREKHGWTRRLEAFEERLKPRVRESSIEPLKAVDKEKEAIEALAGDLETNQTAFEGVMGTGKRLAVDYRAENTQPLKDWMEGAEIHWGETKENLAKRPTELSDLRIQWEQYLDGVFRLHTWLNGIRMKVDEIDPPLTLDEDTNVQEEERKKLVQLQSELESQQPALVGILAAGESLTELSHSLVDTSSLDARMISMQKAWDDVKMTIELRRGELGDPRIKRQRLLREMTSLLNWLSEMGKRMDYILAHPIAGDVDTVKIQRELHVGETQGFKPQLAAREAEVERFLSDGKRVLDEDKGGADDDRSVVESIRRVHGEMGRNWEEIHEKSNQYEKQLDEAMNELQNWQDSCVKLKDCMDSFEVLLKSQGPVSNELASLKEQDQEMEEIINPEMEKLKSLMSDLELSVAKQQKKGLEIPEKTTDEMTSLKRRLAYDVGRATNRGKVIKRQLTNFETQRSFPIPELPSGWIRVETSAGVPYFVNAAMDVTQWDHPELSDVFSKFDSRNKHPGYRTAMKLRSVVNKCCLNFVDLPTLIESAEEYGLSEQNKATIGCLELGNVLSVIYQNVSDKTRAKIDVHKCTDMLLTWLLKSYDASRSGRISVLSFKICMTILCQSHVEDKYRYIFNLVSDAFGYADRQRIAAFAQDANLLCKSVDEETAFPTIGPKVELAVERCFKKAGTKKLIGLSAFLEWMRSEPSILKWFPYVHKLIAGDEVEEKKKRVSGGGNAAGNDFGGSQTCKMS